MTSGSAAMAPSTSVTTRYQLSARVTGTEHSPDLRRFAKRADRLEIAPLLKVGVAEPKDTWVVVGDLRAIRDSSQGAANTICIDETCPRTS